MGESMVTGTDARGSRRVHRPVRARLRRAIVPVLAALLAVIAVPAVGRAAAQPSPMATSTNAGATGGGAPQDAGTYQSVTPTRLVDTRTAHGLPHALEPGGEGDVTVLGIGGVPASGVTGLSLIHI